MRVNLRLKQWSLAGLALTAFCFFAFFFQPFGLNAQNSATKIEFVSPDWVRANASDPDLRILDVRLGFIDYFNSHLPNAVHLADNTVRGPRNGLPVQYFETEKLGSIFKAAGVSDRSRVLVYADGADILGSSAIAYALERISHPKSVHILDGGLTGYRATQETVKEFPKYEPGNLTVKDNPNIRVTLTQVRNLLGKKDVTFIDPRPPQAFAGEVNTFTRNGHIPGARNIPWPTFTTADNQHKLKSLEEIQKILDDKKITKSQDIIVTCTTGREASLQYIVLKHLLGYPKVRLFEGSWTEYSQSDLPVETGAERPLA